jgi:fructokinase
MSPIHTRGQTVVMKNDVICIGEVLWDSLPAGLFLGGAPFNVAFHLHALGTNATVASRVGDDVLGREALRRMHRLGMRTDLVQIDPALETGFVEVELDGRGVPAYVIREPVAWDAIAPEPALLARAKATGVVVFGSLAQRSPTSRATIRAVLEGSALKVWDANLRQPFATWDTVRASLQKADLVKLSEEELQQIIGWAGLDRASGSLAALASTFGCSIICVTRGADGALLWKDHQQYEHPGYRVHVEDTVGVGDAFLAGLIHGLLEGREAEDLLELGNRLGAYVATQRGPTPTYDLSDVDTIRENARSRE